MKLPLGNSYCVDTNVLITLMRYYPQDNPTFKAIWDDIETLIKQGEMFSTKYVYNEIVKYSGEDSTLRKWARKHKKKFFIPLDKETFELARDIVSKFPDLLDKKKLETGENEADPYLIALAKSRGSDIITEESKTKPNKIPVVASHFGVKSINLFEFFGERGLKFVKEE